MQPISTFSHATKDNLRADVFHDTDPESPRDWCNLGTMVCWHSRYTLGDEQSTQDPETWMEEFQEAAEADETSYITLPLYLYDHSGLVLSTAPFSCPWDSGQIGWIYCERGTEDLSDNQITSNLLSEVVTYSQYLSGEVFGVVITSTDEDGEEVQEDSCWGFYGLSYAEDMAQEMLNDAANN